MGRAKALKALIRRELWNADAGWFRAVCSDGKPTMRWTMQMFKAFGWGAKVLDPDMETALLGHLMNPREFLCGKRYAVECTRNGGIVLLENLREQVRRATVK